MKKEKETEMKKIFGLVILSAVEYDSLIENLLTRLKVTRGKLVAEEEKKARVLVETIDRDNNDKEESRAIEFRKPEEVGKHCLSDVSQWANPAGTREIRRISAVEAAEKISGVAEYADPEVIAELSRFGMLTQKVS